MVIDPSQHLDLVNKLEEDAYRGIVGCDFFKIFKNKGLKIQQISWGKGSLQGKLPMREKKAGEALWPAGLNFKYQPTNSYLTRTIVKTVAMEYSCLVFRRPHQDQ